MESLDECVLEGLDFLSSVEIPDLDPLPFKRPLVVGSGNAIVTGKILFEGYDSVFADESTYGEALSRSPIDGAVLVSASGEKHAPIIAKSLKARKIETVLFTTNPNASAREHVGKTYLFPKRSEPYTYNTTTYMAMILAKTRESPDLIKAHIEDLYIPGFKDYQSFLILVPEKYDGIREMLKTKFVELFGRRISRDVFTFEQARHAVTVVPSDDELFISFGKRDETFGKERLFVPLPGNSGYAAMMAIGYYVIGRVQRDKPQWFKENIDAYCSFASQQFGSRIEPIVR